MTEEQIKEAISEAFVRLILAHDGFKIYKAEVDHGVDLTVGPVEKIQLSNGKFMFQDSDRRLDIQLKSTTEKYAIESGKFIEYKLRYKNYQTLKDRVDSLYVKMILVLFVLPEDESTWIDVVENSILLRKSCYWYIPENSAIPSTLRIKSKDSKVKIEIPRTNHLLKNFKSIFNSINNI
ncbi:DUF4365 domain-containing protein [Mucilaginibacter sp. R-33]|uniref:DUF4365 domain-containing protein n=1 Tax=Mucilaginibacter sp. R-33 TaxID=3416711 RepID=UPI003CF64C84